MNYNDSHRIAKKDLHLKYKSDTGHDVPRSIEGDETIQYVDWLEEQLERKVTITIQGKDLLHLLHNESINVKTKDEQ